MAKRKKARTLDAEEQAFMMEFFRMFKHEMPLMAMSMVRDWDIATDIASNAIERLCENVETLMKLNESATRSYVHKVILSSTADFFRKEQRENFDLAQRWGEELEIFTSSEPRFVEDLAICNLSGRELLECLKELPKKDYDLLMGKYFLNLEDEELAEMFNCKTSSIRMKLTRARQKARDILDKGGIRNGSK